MTEWNLDNLNEVIHVKARLGIMSMLMTHEKCEFSFIKQRLGLTDGNLSTHIRKLEEAGYVFVEKKFKKKKPSTHLMITTQGIEAFKSYILTLEEIIKKSKLTD